MNNERGAMEPGTIVLMVCVIGVFVLAGFYAVRQNSKRASMIEDFARHRGWSFARIDDQGLSAKIDPFFPESVFHAYNIMTIETKDRNIRFFDCGYHYRDRRRNESFATGCLIESRRFQSVPGQVEILARTWLDAALLSDQVPVDDNEFSRDFIVISGDRDGARKVLNARLLKVFTDHRRKPLFNPVRVSISGAGAAVLTGLNAEPERWLDLIELVQQVESSMP